MNKQGSAVCVCVFVQSECNQLYTKSQMTCLGLYLFTFGLNYSS